MRKVTRADEAIEVTTAKILLYGQPGIGKTSTAFTAKDVLLLDCDNGAYRSAFRKDAVEVSSWSDIAEISEKDIEEYSTIAIDTVGRLLDYLAAAIIEANPKMGFNGALSLQGYGQLKSQFASWIKRLTTMGKNIVMIAHDKEDKNGDETVVRPDIQGGSMHEVFKLTDAVGYLYHNGKSPILDFNPTSKWLGKNVAKLDAIAVPDFNQNGSFLDETISQIVQAMNMMSAEGKMIADTVKAQREEISKIQTAEGLNEAIQTANALAKPAMVQVKKIILDHSKTLEVEFDKDKGAFVEREKQDAA